MYKTIVYFEDLQDGGRPYNPGDIFPRKGLSVAPERLEELSTARNAQKRPLIKFEGAPEEVIEEPKKVRPRARKAR